jgi:uncharacterized membrane protein
MKPTVKIFIIASVLLNILMAGVIAGHFGKRYVGNDHFKTLPADSQETLGAAMDKVKSDNTTLQEQLTASRKKAAGLLKTEPFDRAAYLSEMERGHKLRGQMASKMALAIADVAEQFTPEQRAALADALRARALHRAGKTAKE